jgi:hypothetical protein
MKRYLVIVSLSLAAMAGCYTEADVGYGYATPGPSMVAVEGAPGVQVLYDADYPVFFYGGIYYRQYGGVWYTSRWYNRGWGVTYNTPGVFARVNTGVYYRGGVGYTSYHAGVYNRGVYNRGGAAYNRGPAATPVSRGGNTVRSTHPAPTRSVPAPRPASRHR